LCKGTEEVRQKVSGLEGVGGGPSWGRRFLITNSKPPAEWAKSLVDETWLRCFWTDSYANAS
jgi:hypothetical protein